jgi:flagellar hook-associated protein 3 FlgL
MVKGIDSYADKFLADLSRIQDRSERVQREISSGYRVSRPSDAPERVMDILQLRSDVDRAMGIQTNLDRVKAEVDTAEAGMRVAIQLVERARVLAAQTANTNSPNRPGIAIEVKELHAQLVDLTRTVSEGRYVFSGDLDQTLLYQTDWTSATGGVTRAAQADNTRKIEDVNGGKFSVAKSAHQLFDVRNPDDTPATANAFNAIYQLGRALENDDEAAVQAAAPLITAALDHLNRQITFYGQAQNRVNASMTLAKDAVIARRKELSAARDTDVAEALVELNLTQVHHDTALAAHARIPRSSLFDFLG